MRLGRIVLLACACALLAALPVRGQTTSAVLAPSATIATLPLTGGGVRSLEFGAVSPGGSADTGVGTEANASTAKWQFEGLRKSVSVLLQFTLPDLTNGTVTLPVTWSNPGYGTWCARRAPATEAACGGAGTLTGTFNPADVGTTSSTPAGPGNNDRTLSVWVGARLLAVPANTPAGTYTGTATLLITVL